jgi:hypothetical protein
MMNPGKGRRQRVFMPITGPQETVAGLTWALVTETLIVTSWPTAIAFVRRRTLETVAGSTVLKRVAVASEVATTVAPVEQAFVDSFHVPLPGVRGGWCAQLRIRCRADVAAGRCGRVLSRSREAITVPQSKTTVFEYRVLQIGSQMSFDVFQAESKHDHVCESQTYLAVDSQRFVADEEGFPCGVDDPGREVSRW